jgi:hypothetical protein
MGPDRVGAGAGASGAGLGAGETRSALPLAPEFDVPRYGARSIADVAPSVLEALGVEPVAGPLGLDRASRACLLIIDGLGANMVERHRERAPTIHGLQSSEPLTAAFPCTTAVCLASLGLGCTPGEHGFLGFTMFLPQLAGGLFDVLGWRVHGVDESLGGRFAPDRLQSRPTALEIAARAGIASTAVGPSAFSASPYTRATLRPSRYRGADTAEQLVEETLAALRESERAFVSSYYPFVDLASHRFGLRSPEVGAEIATADEIVRGVAEALPSDTLLVVTADHGLVDVPRRNLIDLADFEELSRDVRYLGGEARARHVYTEPGRAAAVLSRWREVIGDRMQILERDDAAGRGLFGPLSADHRRRIGDLVAIARTPVGIVDRTRFAAECELAAHHGSLTDDERLVPLIAVRN